MNNPGTDSKLKDDLRSQAREWVVRLATGEATEKDLDQLGAWRSQSIDNRRAFAEASLVWELLGDLKPNTTKAEVIQLRTRASIASTMLNRRFFLGAGLAASVAGVFTVGSSLNILPNLDAFRADKATEVGQRLRFAVQNGATVDLNTKSSLNVEAHSADGVRVHLLAGEAAINGVAAETRITVRAGSGQVSGVRSAFNIRRDANLVTVTCLDGSVEVECGSARAILAASQQVMYTGLTMSAPLVTDTKAAASWIDGLLIFRQATVEHVVSEVNRYRRGRIFVTNEELGQRTLFATFRLDNLDDVVPKLVEVVGAKATEFPGVIFLS